MAFKIYLIGCILLVAGIPIVFSAAASDSSSSSNSDLCSQIRVKVDTDVRDVGPLTGRWYEVSEFGVPGSPVCEVADYTLTGSNQFSVYVNLTGKDGKTFLTTGLGDLSAPGVLSFDINTRTSTTKMTTYDYRVWSVLGTDYLNYLTVYSCSTGYPEITILLRNPTPSEEIWKLALDAEKRNNLPAIYRDVGCVIQDNSEEA